MSTIQRRGLTLVCGLIAIIISACVRGPSEADRLLTVPEPVLQQGAAARGHAPSLALIESDRDETLKLLDSLYAHYSRDEQRVTSMSRAVALGALIVGAIGASSSALVDGDRAERKLSQGASALTALLAGLATEFQLSRKSEARKACTAALYNALSDVRIRYGNATLPATDSTWARYVLFKDSVDRAIHLNCQ